MNRETRKANLRKLQLPGTSSGTTTRKKSSLKGSSTSTTAISNYFSIPSKSDHDDIPPPSTNNHDVIFNEIVDNSHNPNGMSPQSKEPQSPLPPNNVETSTNALPTGDTKIKLGKRTKLTSFLYKDKSNIPNTIQPNADDFEEPLKKVKKAPKSKAAAKPKSKTTRSKGQPNIKSAFLRNEQLFSEITAQHCLADNFSPEDMQIALALSKSEAETSGILCVDDEEETVVDVDKRGDDVQESIRIKLQRYGFRTAPKEEYNNIAAAFRIGERRKKSKWANKFTALTCRDPALQSKKVNERIDAFFRKQVTTKDLSTTEQYMEPYHINSSTLKRICPAQSAEIIRDAEYLNTSILSKFYVQSLFNISHVKVGNLLKDWTRIQGRDLSPDKKSSRSRELEEKLSLAYKDLDKFFSKGCQIEKKSIIDENIQQKNKTDVDKDSPPTQHETASTHSQSETNLISLTEKIVLQPELHEASENRKAPETRDVPSPQKEEKHAVNISLEQITIEVTNKQIIEQKQAANYVESEKNTTIARTTRHCARVTSPDIFADSDSDMEEIKNKSITEKQDVISEIQILSSDEENTGFCENSGNENMKVVDLTQEDEGDEEINPHEISSSATQVENVDIFIPSKSQPKLDDDVAASYITRKRRISASYVLSSDEEVLMDIQADGEGRSFLNFEGDRQLSTSFHLKTASLKPNDFNISATTVENVENVVENAAPSKILVENVDKFVTSPSKSPSKLDDDITRKRRISASYVLSSDEEVLMDIQADGEGRSFLNFEGDRQLSTSFHLKTASLKPNDFNISAANNTSNFEVLKKKYLRNDVNSRSIRKSISMTQIHEPQSHRSFKAGLSFTQMENDAYNSIASPPTPTVNHTSKSPNAVSNKSLDHCTKSSSFNWGALNSSFSQRIPSNNEDIVLGTQNFDNDDSDDDCIVLSDDEINYSICMANKTRNLRAEDENSIHSEDLSMSSTTVSENEADTLSQQQKSYDSDRDLDLQENIESQEALSQQQKGYHSDGDLDLPQNKSQFDSPHLGGLELSFLDLIAGEKSFKSIDSFKRKSTSDVEKKTDQSEPILVDLCTPTEEKQSDLRRERAEFGILDSFSEPFTQSPYKTPPHKSANEPPDDASFFDSPSETTAPMKRYSCSKSSQKFNDLVKSIEKNEATGYDSFDEFDELVFGKKEPKELPKPAGFDQLLTGEISFHDDCYQTPKKDSPPIKVRDPLPKSISSQEGPEDLEIDGKIYTVRVTTSPKPDFVALSDFEIQERLHNFGIKPLKREEALVFLEFIDSQMHPTVLRDEEQETEPKSQHLSPAITPQSSPVKQSKTKTAKANLFTDMAPTESPNLPASLPSSKLNLKDCSGELLLRHQHYLVAELENEEYIFQTNTSKKISQALLPLHVAWFNLVSSSSTLHEAILMFEPIDLQEVYLFFKSLGYRYFPKDLKNFFDRRCIIFRYNLTNPSREKENNRHVRKKKSKTILKT